MKIVKSGVNLDEAILLAEQNFEQVKRAYQTDSNFRKSWDDFVKYRKHSFARPLIEKMSSIDEMFSAIPQFFDLISAATDAEIEKKSIAYGITNKFSTVEIGNLTSYLPTAYLFKKYDDIKNFLRKDPSFCCMRCSNLWTG
ncbi:MAG: antirestriction protein ArdA [Candidatus Micrarchaeota archaeon]|nr:antirestriction protein ArdA [Candidatus Micrarchaeota archaeon]